MASIKRLKDLVRGKERNLPWRVSLHHPNAGPEWNRSQCFATREEAEIWAAQQELDYRMRDTPEYLKRRAHEKLGTKTTEDLMRDYRHKGLCKSEKDFFTLDAFTREFRAIKKPLSKRLRPDVITYRDQRIGREYRRDGWTATRVVTADRVKRELALLRSVFQKAIDDEWEGYEGLENPFTRIKFTGVSFQGGRDRSLQPGELGRLEEAFDNIVGMNRYYLPLAVYLAIETGMRAGEIFNLLWSDVQLDKRRIWIKQSKTDRMQREKHGLPPGRTIVLPYFCKLQLLQLKDYLTNNNQYDPEGRIFPLTREGKKPNRVLLEAFTIAREQARIKPSDKGEMLRFHDLRRAANTFFEDEEGAGLSPIQVKLMRGKVDRDTADVYRNRLSESHFRRIQKKLDIFQIGCTEAELIKAGQGYDLAKVQKYLEETTELEPESDLPVISFERLEQQVVEMEEGEKEYTPEQIEALNKKVTLFKLGRGLEIMAYLGERTIREAAKLFDQEAATETPGYGLRDGPSANAVAIKA
jgi:integrase